MADKAGTKQIAVNRQARHEYFVIEALETGIELVGTEVKSLRAGAVNPVSYTHLDVYKRQSPYRPGCG